MAKKNILQEALKHFGLGINFTEKELKEAYNNRRNIIPVDFKSRKINHDEINKNYMYYVELYKWAKIKYIGGTLLKDANIDNVLEEGKPKILNLSNECIDFYNKNFLYHSIVNTLLVNIKTNYDLFCNIDLEKANTIEDVDTYLDKFILESRRDFEKFAADIINVVAEESTYNLNDEFSHLDSKKIDSIKKLLVEVYEAVKKIIGKKEMINTFTSRVKENFEIKATDDEVQITEEEKVKNHEIQKEAMKYYAVMVKEKDYNKFLEVYKEAMKYIDSQMPATLEQQEGKRRN